MRVDFCHPRFNPGFISFFPINIVHVNSLSTIFLSINIPASLCTYPT